MSYLHLYLPCGDHAYAVSAELRSPLQCHLIDEAQGAYLARRSGEPLLRSHVDSNVYLMEAHAPPR